MAHIYHFSDRLQLGGNPSITDIHTLNALATTHPNKPLRFIWADAQGLSHLKELTAITSLSLEHSEVEDLSALSKMTWLKCLHIGTLKYRHRYDLSPLFDLNLQHLSLHKINDNTHDLTGIDRLEQLESLQLSGKFKKHSAILNSPHLHTLATHPIWIDIPNSQLDGVRQLILHSGRHDEFGILSATPSLNSLKLSQLKLSDPALLHQLPSMDTLKTLELFHVKNLSDLSFLANLPSLQNLKLTTLPDLIRLDGIEYLPNLDTLNISLYRNRHTPNLDKLLKLPKHIKITLSGNSPFCGLSDYVDDIKHKLIRAGHHCT